jgi:hypothetical protein
MAALEELGGGQPQHRIAKEFQLFVVAAAAGGGVGEGLLDRGQGRGIGLQVASACRLAAGDGIDPEAGQECGQLLQALAADRG